MHVSDTYIYMNSCFHFHKLLINLIGAFRGAKLYKMGKHMVILVIILNYNTKLFKYKKSITKILLNIL